MHFVLPVNTHVLSPSAFDYSIYKQALAETAACITLDTFDANSTRDTLNGIIATLSQATNNKDMQQDLISYLNKVDSRRNLNWRETFPWLEKAINNVV
jgi:hypothetical protein